MYAGTPLTTSRLTAITAAGAVAARGFVYGQVGYAVGLGDNTMGNPVAEGITDRRQVRREAVSRNLRGAKHAAPKILHE
jgi:hypothetical protein